MSDSEQSTLEKLHSETALMSWKDLQRFFAQGNLLCVDKSLDLVQSAVWFADDAAEQLAPLIESNAIVEPSNDQARAWFDDNTELWTVVVAPFVLVQEQKTALPSNS